MAIMTTIEDGDDSITNQIFNSDWNEEYASLMLKPCVLLSGGAIHLGDNDSIMTDGTILTLNSLLESVRNYLADKYELPAGFTMTMPSTQDFLDDEIRFITDVQKL